ncbi:hypothetical protein AAFC00_001163 [Neodothiora populina]|uniref:Uncharacterized protein n=1 Tax=Neodothiora populina TaxID=2781224 RepID=A0ABR3PN19_9PEZI
MVAKKKKSKPAANPARGFATTSIVSKSRVDSENATVDTTAINTAAENSGVASPALASNVATLASSDKKASVPAKEAAAKELHELNPEELEAQLNLSDLQNLVEQQGPKVKKESSRQVSRLQTDRRVLRSQADLLTVREWLPDELMQQIIDLALEEERTIAANSNPTALKRFSEDELLSRTWQLHLALIDLDIPGEQTQKVLQYILANPPADEAGNFIWALPEALDWLAIHCESGQLLGYDTQKPKPQSTIPETASAEDDDAREDWKKAKQREAATKPEPSSAAPVIDDIQVSDADSDMDPDEMISTYLRTKARLFDRSPDLVTEPLIKGNKKSKKLQTRPTTVNAKATPGEAKLQQRLKKLESDALFDQYTADLKWLEQRNELMQERSERRRLRLDEERKDTPQSASSPSGHPLDRPAESSATDDIMAEAEREAQKLLAEMEEDDGISGMFGEPTESTSREDGAPGDTGATNISVSIRNFGKITGISPRRTFEEACRSRDSGAKVYFKLVSPTTYSARHSVTVTWSKDQDAVDPALIDGVKVQSSTRKTIVTMTGIACPDTSQSEAYVSTVSLFLLFSSSPKEERVALRLPPAFRDLWQEFIDARREKRDSADRDTVKSLRELIRLQTEEEADEDIVLTAGFRNRQKGLSGVSTPVEGEKKDGRPALEESQALKDMWLRKASTPSYQSMLQSRMNLPMYQFRDVALDIIEKNPVTILCGETGCGKSTQMPAFILEHELSRGRPCKVYCTEPRRISAISLAQRVSEEMGDDKGAVGTSRSLVGYSIRLESHTTAQTRLVYATVGIVLRMLESAKGIDDVTHLVIDEIHERSIDTDFLLIVLQSLLLRRPDLKVVLMSATVDAQRFSSYLGNAPIVTVPGRTFPVQAKFLEDAIEVTGHTIDTGNKRPAMEDDEDDIDRTVDGAKEGSKQLSGYSAKTRATLADFDEYGIDYELIVKLLAQVAYNPTYTQFSQAILVFLPGLAEIRQLHDALLGHPSFAQGWLFYPLHSTFSSEDQQAAFNVPPRGMRKIVLATNIAETGITIPDVTCVIDTGKHKEMRFDERRQLSRLIQSFISRANAKQRRGRAGRVQEGICFHLFTKYRHDNIMAESQTPEMLRLSLQDLVMRVKICKLGDIEHALSQALDPPSLKNIRRAIDALIDVDALTQNEELTPLGQQLAKLPLDAQLGKLILLASIFNCADFALTTAAILSSKSPFLSPMNAKKQADTVRLGYKRGNSDLLTAYNAYLTWKKICQTPGQSEFQFCKKNFLSPQNLSNIEDLKGQLLSSLSEAGFVHLSPAERQALSRVRGSSSGRGTRNFVQVPAGWDQNTENDLLLNSVTAWSFYPKVLQRDGKGWRNIGNNQSISLHPTSVNKGNNSLDAKLLSFYSIMQSASRFTNAQETSPVEAMALVLLAGDARFDVYSGVIVIDGNRLRFKVSSWRAMVALKMLRARMRDILAKSMKNPGRVMGPRQREWMDVFVSMFERVDKERRLGKA